MRAFFITYGWCYLVFAIAMLFLLLLAGFASWRTHSKEAFQRMLILVVCACGASAVLTILHLTGILPS